MRGRGEEEKDRLRQEDVDVVEETLAGCDKVVYEGRVRKRGGVHEAIELSFHSEFITEA